MEKYIGDDTVTLMLAGLRFLVKEDYSPLSGKEKFRLRWNYKGTEGSIYYETKEARDAMYDRVLRALTAGNKT